MAYQRDGAGALSLSNHALHRRRQAIKRAIRKARANAASAPPQAIIIGPGGTTNLEPVFSGGQGASDIQSGGDDTESGNGSFQDGQSNLASQAAPDPPAPSLIALPIGDPLPASFNPPSSQIVPVSAPNSIQTSVPVANPRPSSASSGFSLVTNVVTQSTVISSGQTTSKSSSSAPTTSSPDNPSNSQSISSTPPIVAGILLAGVLAIAAVAAIISWILRARRRRYNNHLADLGLDGSSLENAFTEPTVAREKDMEEGIPEPPVSRIKMSDYPVYVEPRTGVYDQEMYPSESQLHHTPYQNDPYYPALQITNLTPGDLSVEGHGQVHNINPSAYPPPPAVLSDFGTMKDTAPRPVVICGHAREQSVYQNGSSVESFPSTSTLPSSTSASNLHPARNDQPANPSSWSFGFSSNIVSALDAVKQAAGDRMLTMSSWSNRAAPHDQEKGEVTKDRFTPLALRPGRQSLGGMPVRRGTKEEQELSFGGSRRDLGWDGDSATEERSRDGSSFRHDRASRLDGLGAFSFEGVSPSSRSGARGVGTRKKQPVTRSARLGLRDSTGISTSTSTSRSGSGSGVGPNPFSDGRMRKRKSRQAAY